MGETPWRFKSSHPHIPHGLLANQEVTSGYPWTQSSHLHYDAEQARFVRRTAAATVLVSAETEQERPYVARERSHAVFRREVKSLPAYEKAQAATGSGIAPPVDEMNQMLMGLVVATQRSFHLLADRIEQIENV